MILIGYSGHAFVVCGILQSAGQKVTGYCDSEEKENNPFNLVYHGTETADKGLLVLQNNDFFIAIGDNQIRRKIYGELCANNLLAINAIHVSAIIDSSANIAVNAVMIAAQVTINPLAMVDTGAICNTGCIIEHECYVGKFAHIGPGAVLCGNVTVGDGSFVGANAVIKQGLSIGKNAIIGAGAVVIKDVPDSVTVYGVPAR